jgi:o-succinylbenzoate synthase
MIEFWRYELQPLTALNAKSPADPCEGALIRVAGGHGCVHPWSTLGDAPLEEQLRLLAAGEPTALGERALHCCAVDAAARADELSLFDGVVIPKSHVTVAAVDALTDADVLRFLSGGFDCVKIKLGPDAARAAQQVNAVAFLWKSPGAANRIRLDFNGTLDFAGVRQFAQVLDPVALELIDFVEDPCPYDAEQWRALQRETGLRFALDRDSDRFPADSAFPVRVWKPACAPPPVPSDGERLVVTSYMDHAIGQVFAAYEAAVFPGELETCGLLTHPLFQQDTFFGQLQVQGARLVPPPGPGLGFGAMLAALPWKALT